LRIPGYYEFIELFKDLVVGEEGLNQLLLISSRKFVEGHLAKLIEGSGDGVLLVVRSEEDIFFYLFDAVVYDLVPLVVLLISLD
jgi:hypothetical protein